MIMGINLEEEIGKLVVNWNGADAGVRSIPLLVRELDALARNYANEQVLLLVDSYLDRIKVPGNTSGANNTILHTG